MRRAVEWAIALLTILACAGLIFAVTTAHAAEGPNKSVGEFLRNSDDVKIAYAKGVMDALAVTDYFGQTKIGDATCGRFRSYGELIGSTTMLMYRALGKDAETRESPASIYVMLAMKECSR